MKTTKTWKWCLGAAVACFGLATLPGCELLVQFDRNKIDGGGGDSTAPDSQSQEETSTGADATSDTTIVETGVDAPADTMDASEVPDGGADAATDGDANEDAEDALADADASGDATEEGSEEAAVEAGEDATEGGEDATDDGADSSSSDSGDAE